MVDIFISTPLTLGDLLHSAVLPNNIDIKQHNVLTNSLLYENIRKIMNLFIASNY